MKNAWQKRNDWPFWVKILVVIFAILTIPVWLPAMAIIAMVGIIWSMLFE